MNGTVRTYIVHILKYVMQMLSILGFLFVLSRYVDAKMGSIDSHISILVCGDSHTMTAINPEYLSYSMNISRTSQPYYYTFKVLELILNTSTNIDTVVLGYSYHSFSPVFNIMQSDMEVAQENCAEIDKYIMILDVGYLYKLIKSNPLEASRMIAIESLSVLTRLRRSMEEKEYIGSYYNSGNSNVNRENIERAIRRHYYSMSNEESVAYFYNQERYLFAIDTLCSNRNIQLVLVNTPIHNMYYSNIPSDVICSYYSRVDSLDAMLLDLHDFPLPDSCFGDGDHLNRYGAEVFSTHLDSLFN